MFIDEVEIFVKGGEGGGGCVSFHREKFRPLGGPDGGDGGRGGCVILRASESVNTLIEYARRRHYRARKGGSGSANNSHGADGEDIVLQVPAGTQVRDESGTLIADLAQAGREATVAKGGRGGRGNAAFATPARRSPDFAEKGEPGQERWIRLELKLLADVGLVGFPNAGKSTLISRISAARPRVADYPFTTLEPVLGVVRAGEEQSFVISDLPGLIEGAHEGKGLGLKFLRHIERTVLLVHMLDLSPAAETPPAHALEVVLGELASYSPRMAERPQVVAGNKLDVADERRLMEAREAAASWGWDFFPISAVTGEGVSDLVWRLAEMVDEAREEEPSEIAEERTVYSYDPLRERGFRVVRDKGGFRVIGERVEKLLYRMDITNPQALAYVQGSLKKMGVEDELLKQGAQEGDAVIIGDHVFDFLPEA